MIHRIVAVVCCCIWWCVPAMAGQKDPVYGVNAIPASITKGATAVVRKHELEIKILSLREVLCTETVAITILNENGAKYAQLQEGYKKIDAITAVHGWLYDKDGKLIKKTRKNDVKDWGNTGENFLDDTRYKMFSFNYVSYPYTVVYELERRANQTFFIPKWQPMPGYGCAVEQGGLRITYPDSLAIRYATYHLADTATITHEQGSTTIAVRISELPAVQKPVEYAPTEIFTLPTVVAVADSFELEGRRGSVRTWADHGQFVYELNKNRDTLPSELKRVVHSLTDTCKDERKKIVLLYDHLQQNTRYVSIQLGIGGWQTMMAETVAANGYGDCKALSNYMLAMLKEVGITSYMVLIRSGQDEANMVLPKMAYNVFNHVILCVPMVSDTIWLDCTSKMSSIGQLSGFTAGREALLLQDKNSTIVSTPDGDTAHNKMVRKAVYNIAGVGTVACDVYERHEGMLWGQEAAIVLKRTKSEVGNYMNRKYTLPTYAVQGYEINNDAEGSPLIMVTAHMTASGVVKSSGKRLFVTTGVFRCPLSIPAADAERNVPFELSMSFAVSDTVVLKKPTDYSAGVLPAATVLRYPFGGYRHEVYAPNDSTVVVATSYYEEKGVYPAYEFKNYSTFCRKASSSSGEIVLTKRD